MTTSSPIAQTITPIRLRTMTSALLFAHRLGEDLTAEHLLHIARGNKGVADALFLRILLLAKLLETEPDIASLLCNLSPRELAAVLAVTQLDPATPDSIISLEALSQGVKLAASRTTNEKFN